MLKSASNGAPLKPRQLLRRRLLELREQFVAGPGAADAGAALGRHLRGLLAQLEPALLGLYWPYRCEFNAADALAVGGEFAKSPIALPFAQRVPVRMHYRLWSGAAPTSVDDCGIPCADGAAVVPDVVLAPCVGYTAGGYRLGYGGGYFDRWLAEHPHVTSIGIAWSVGEIDAVTFDVQPHDQPLGLIVTERGVI
jgi:5-formyltetrahydrofolate cyclo-ligase